MTLLQIKAFPLILGSTFLLASSPATIQLSKFHPSRCPIGVLRHSVRALKTVQRAHEAAATCGHRLLLSIAADRCSSANCLFSLASDLALEAASIHTLSTTANLPNILALYPGIELCLEAKLSAEIGVVRGCTCIVEDIILSDAEPYLISTQYFFLLPSHGEQNKFTLPSFQFLPSSPFSFLFLPGCVKHSERTYFSSLLSNPLMSHHNSGFFHVTPPYHRIRYCMVGEACWSWTWPFFSGSSHAPLAVLSAPTIRRQFPPGPRQQAFPAATTMPTSTHKHFCHDRLPAARTNVAGYYFGSGKTTSNDRRGLPYVASLWPHVLTFLSSFVSPTLILYPANFDSFPPPSSTVLYQG